MGTQHNTHIYNDCGETVKIILSDSNSQKKQYTLENEQLICIPTVQGVNTIFVYKWIDNGTFSNTAEASCTDKSDISFIVKKVGRFLEVVKSKYGSFLCIKVFS